MYPNEAKISKKEIYPLKLYKFGNLYVNGPNNPYPYLIRAYGKNYNKIVKNNYVNHSDGKYSKECSFDINTVMEYIKNKKNNQ